MNPPLATPQAGSGILSVVTCRYARRSCGFICRQHRQGTRVFFAKIPSGGVVGFQYLSIITVFSSQDGAGSEEGLGGWFDIPAGNRALGAGMYLRGGQRRGVCW